MKGVRIDDKHRITKYNSDPDPIVLWITTNKHGIILWNQKYL